MIFAYKNVVPQLDADVYVAHNATVIGDVHIEEGSSVWFGSVIRGDSDAIYIGKHTNIQDNCTLHTDVHHTLIIKDHVSVGHRAILHGAFIEDHVMIGMGAIVLNGAHIGRYSMIGAGALIKENQVIPAGSVVVGCPGKVIKTVEQSLKDHIDENAIHYRSLACDYKDMEERVWINMEKK